MTKSDGGTAFPYHWQDSIQGMSLRDWFAGRALSLMMGFEDQNGPFQNVTDETRAARAYQLADAMIAERAKAESH